VWQSNGVRSFLLVFVMLAACDLQPAKRDRAAGAVTKSPAPPPVAPSAKVPEPAGSAAPAPAPGSAAPAPAPGSAAPAVGSGSAKPLMVTTEDCTNVAVHIANVVIESIEDPSIKAAQEQDRTRLVRRVAETCTRDKWAKAAQTCFLKGKTAPELEACGRELAAP
jgi:hypothetical protein